MPIRKTPTQTRLIGSWTGESPGHAAGWEACRARMRRQRRIDLGDDHARIGSGFRQHFAPGRHDQAVAIGLAAIGVQCRLAPAAITKAPFSMARARSSTCQCASPVGTVKADGTVKAKAPFCASAR